jgi:hypothetical protein
MAGHNKKNFSFSRKRDCVENETMLEYTQEFADF